MRAINCLQKRFRNILSNKISDFFRADKSPVWIRKYEHDFVKKKKRNCFCVSPEYFIGSKNLKFFCSKLRRRDWVFEICDFVVLNLSKTYDQVDFGLRISITFNCVCIYFTVNWFLKLNYFSRHLRGQIHHEFVHNWTHYTSNFYKILKKNSNGKPTTSLILIFVMHAFIIISNQLFVFLEKID